MSEEPNDIAAALARCLRGSDGERVLDYLRRTTLERRLPPDCTEAELRHLEGQRWLATQIMQLARRGRGTS